MATYTDTTTFARDFDIAGAGEKFPRLVQRAAALSYNYINARLAGVYETPFEAPYPANIVDISDMLTRWFAKNLQSGRNPIVENPKDRAPKNECQMAVMMLDD